MPRTRRFKSRLALIFAMALLLATILGCIGTSPSAEEVEATAYTKLTAEAGVEITAYAKLTATAESWTPTPSNTPTPTNTPTNTPTPTPRPTNTATPTPTATPRPPTPVPVPMNQQVMRYLNDSHPYRSTEEGARATLIQIWNNTRKLSEAVNAVDAYVKTVEPILPKLEKVKAPSAAKDYHDHYVGTIYKLFEAIKAINWGIVQNSNQIVTSAINDANKYIYELYEVDKELEALTDKYGLYFNGNTGKWEKKP